MRSLRDKKQAELLAPAGSFEAARTAVNAGADAIYMGGPLFSARAYAESSQEEMLFAALEYAHLRGVRVYMTLNTLIKEQELSGLEDYLQPYVDAGLDAVIVQDFGVMQLVLERFPGLALHVSTQAAVTGPGFAKRLRDFGANRVVLARELSLSEIARIRESTDLEIEAFAHGALCYAVSGQCLMSSMIGGRSGNRGRCAGTCRLPYGLYDDQNQKCSASNEQYLLSMADLNTVNRLSEMLRAGVDSFKIEGRMKSPLYVAAVTSVYRKYLDQALGKRPKIPVTKEDRALLLEGFARDGETDAYLDGRNGREMLTLREKPSLRTHREELLKSLEERYIKRDRKLRVCAELKVAAGEALRLTLRTDPGEDKRVGPAAVTLLSDYIVQEAGNRPAGIEELKEKLNRFGETDFELGEARILLEGNCFVPMGALHELRRNAADALKAKLLAGMHTDI